MRVKYVVKTSVAAVCLAFAGAATALTMEQAVQSAMTTSPKVLAAVNQKLARQYELDMAKSGYRPTVDLSAGVGYESTDNNSTRARGHDWYDLTRKEAELNIRQMLFDGFATSSEVDRQKARIQSQELKVLGTSENVGLEAVKLYIEVLRQKEFLELSSENLQAHARVFDQVELRSNSGVGRSSDLNQITGRRSSASANLLADDVNLRDAESAFITVVGMLPKELEPAPDVAALPASLEEAIQMALENHPTLKSAGADVNATIAQHNAAKKGYYPRVDLELGARYGEDLDGTEGRDSDMTAMLKFRYNLYAGGRDSAHAKKTAYLINEAKSVRDKTYREVVESMRLSWTAYEATTQQLEFLSEYVSSSTKTRDAYAKQFNLSKRTLLDLLDTENELYEAKRERVDAMYDNKIAQYRILAALGHLKEYLNVELPEAAEVESGFSDLISQSAMSTESTSFKKVLKTPKSLQEKKQKDAKAVKDIVESWRAAWAGKDIEKYLSHYADEFKPRESTKAAWEKKRRRIIGNAKSIDLKLEDMKVTLDSRGAVVDFTQIYTSNTYADQVKKRLRLKPGKGAWQIVAESDR